MRCESIAIALHCFYSEHVSISIIVYAINNEANWKARAVIADIDIFKAIILLFDRLEHDKLMIEYSLSLIVGHSNSHFQAILPDMQMSSLDGENTVGSSHILINGGATAKTAGLLTRKNVSMSVDYIPIVNGLSIGRAITLLPSVKKTVGKAQNRAHDKALMQALCSRGCEVPARPVGSQEADSL